MILLSRKEMEDGHCFYRDQWKLKYQARKSGRSTRDPGYEAGWGA